MEMSLRVKRRETFAQSRLTTLLRPMEAYSLLGAAVKQRNEKICQSKAIDQLPLSRQFGPFALLCQMLLLAY